MTSSRGGSAAQLPIIGNGTGETKDPYFRYKMPQLKVRVKRGTTHIVNIQEVAAALHRSATVVTSFFGKDMGTRSKLDKEGMALVKGNHSAATLQQRLNIFIDKFVLCGKCSLPETVLMVGAQKQISQDCRACGARSSVNMDHPVCRTIAKEARKQKRQARDRQGKQQHGEGKASGSAASASASASDSAAAGGGVEMQVLNFLRRDPFADAAFAVSVSVSIPAIATRGFWDKVHIRKQMRSRNKCKVIVEGLDEDINKKDLSKEFANRFHCSCCIKVDEKTRKKVLELQGDVGRKVKSFLVKNTGYRDDQIVLHGS